MRRIYFFITKLWEKPWTFNARLEKYLQSRAYIDRLIKNDPLNYADRLAEAYYQEKHGGERPPGIPHFQGKKLQKAYRKYRTIYEGLPEGENLPDNPVWESKKLIHSFDVERLRGERRRCFSHFLRLKKKMLNRGAASPFQDGSIHFWLTENYWFQQECWVDRELELRGIRVTALPPLRGRPGRCDGNFQPSPALPTKNQSKHPVDCR